MEIQIKQVSSLETIFSYDTAAELKRAAVFRGERFSYQLLFQCDERNRYQISVNAPGLGNAVTLYTVKNAVMDYPFDEAEPDSDLLTKTPGLMPDILVPAEDEENRIMAGNNELQIVWVRVDVPEEIAVGTYPITIEFTPLRGHWWEYPAGETVTAVMELELLPLALPRQTLKYTQWFYVDCIADYYNVPVYSERHWELIEAYIETAVDSGVNLILTPVITPPLDTARDTYRTNVQLIDIKVEGDKYIFNCDKLERWIDICLKKKIEYFEIAQLFSQWGLKFAPGIVAEVNGKKEYIFGWHTSGTDPRYAEFLKQFVPVVVDCLKRKGVFERSFFHISDEPHINSFEAYKYGYELLKPMIGSAKIFDALSEYSIYEAGLVDIPCAYTAMMDEFLEKGAEEQWVYYAEDRKGISIRHLSAPPYRNRVMGIQLYKYDIKGFLHWGYNFYNTIFSYHKINPYLTTSGNKTMVSGGNFTAYPSANGALLSTRALVFYEGLQDFAACQLLEKYVGREQAVRIIEDEAEMEITFSDYPRNSTYLPGLRRRIAAEIQKASE